MESDLKEYASEFSHNPNITTEIIDKHPDIIESCVSGIEDEKFGEIVGAYVYAKNPIDKEDLILFLKDKLANYKIPEVVLFTDDALPRIASEKIDRVTVKKLLS